MGLFVALQGYLGGETRAPPDLGPHLQDEALTRSDRDESDDPDGRRTCGPDGRAPSRRRSDGTSRDLNQRCVKVLRDAAGREGRDIKDVALAVVTSAGRVPRHSPTPTTMPSGALTLRKLEILRELPTMSTAEEIASALFVSVNTVKTHVRSIYQKLGVTSRRDAGLA